MIQVVRRSIVDVYSQYSFNRQSLAYDSKGKLYHLHNARFEPGKFGQAVMVEEGTTNLDTPDPSFESGVDGFFVVGTGGAISSSTDWRIFGNKSLKVVTDGSYAAVQATKSYGDKHGQTLTVSIYAYTPTGSRVRVEFYDATNKAWLNGVTRDMPAGEVYRFVVTQVVPANCTDIRLYLRPSFGIAQVKTVYFDGLLLEQKPYATSFIDGTRSPETLTIPKSVLNQEQGTIKFWVKRTNLNTAEQQLIDQRTTNKGINIRCSNNTIGFVTGNGSMEHHLYSSVLSWTDWHHIAVTWSVPGQFKRIYSNGVKVAESTSWTTGLDLGTNDIHIGKLARSTSHYINALYDDLRISSRAWTDEEILAAHQSGEPLPVDADTTLKLDFDGPDGQRAANVLVA